MSIVAAALNLLLLAATLANCQQQQSVYQAAKVQCVPDDSPVAVAHVRAVTETHCAMSDFLTGLTGALLIQFNSDTGTCAIFNFQSICRSLIPGKTANCEVFYRFPIDHRAINSKLNSVWLGDSVSRLENLVCQADEDTNRLHLMNVEWSSEGAKFDGTTAYAMLQKSSLNFSTGLTWLLKIKRQPKLQPFIEFTDCNNMNAPTRHGVHLWEYGSPRQLFARTNQITGTLLPFIYSPADALPASSEDWINFGLTVSGSEYDVFMKDSFLLRSSLPTLSDSSPCSIINANACLYVGLRIRTAPAPNDYFSGTLRALAIANSSMSEVEIREFFDLVA